MVRVIPMMIGATELMLIAAIALLSNLGLKPCNLLQLL